MKVILSILFEIAVVFVILIVLRTFGCQSTQDEVSWMTEYAGLGATVGCFGLLWGIGSFFRMNKGIGSWIASITCAFGLVLFGVTTSLWGLGWGLIVGGVYGLFSGGNLVQITEETKALGSILVMLSIGSILIGLPMKSHTAPTKQVELTDYQIGDHPAAVWTIEFNSGMYSHHTYSADLSHDKSFAVVGGSDKVKAARYQIVSQLGLDLDSTSVPLDRILSITLHSVPDDHARSIGAFDMIGSEEKLRVKLEEMQ